MSHSRPYHWQFGLQMMGFRIKLSTHGFEWAEVERLADILCQRYNEKFDVLTKSCHREWIEKHVGEIHKQGSTKMNRRK